MKYSSASILPTWTRAYTENRGMINYELKIHRGQKVSLSLSLSLSLSRLICTFCATEYHGIPHVLMIVFFPPFSHSYVYCAATGPYIKMIYCHASVTRPSTIVIIIFIETFDRWSHVAHNKHPFAVWYITALPSPR
jgi:hypothetical protein